MRERETAAGFERTKRLIAGDGGDELRQIPLTFRLAGDLI